MRFERDIGKLYPIECLSNFSSFSYFFFFFFLSIFERYIAHATKNGKGEKRKIELWNTINQ